MPAKDETGLFLERFVDRMPVTRMEEMRARDKVANMHGLWDAEVDSLLYECPLEELWAVRPEGRDLGGVDLWEVIGTTDAGRLIFVVGRMGNDGFFRLISARALTEPEGGDVGKVRAYRQLLAERGNATDSWE